MNNEEHPRVRDVYKGKYDLTFIKKKDYYITMGKRSNRKGINCLKIDSEEGTIKQVGLSYDSRKEVAYVFSKEDYAVEFIGNLETMKLENLVVLINGV